MLITKRWWEPSQKSAFFVRPQTAHMSIGARSGCAVWLHFTSPLCFLFHPGPENVPLWETAHWEKRDTHTHTHTHADIGDLSRASPSSRFATAPLCFAAANICIWITQIWSCTQSNLMIYANLYMRRCWLPLSRMHTHILHSQKVPSSCATIEPKPCALVRWN